MLIRLEFHNQLVVSFRWKLKGWWWFKALRFDIDLSISHLNETLKPTTIKGEIVLVLLIRLEFEAENHSLHAQQNKEWNQIRVLKALGFDEMRAVIL